jgi:putative heme degradation protein
MPSKKRPPKPPGPPWQIVLEEIRSQNRATIEAVEAARVALEQRLDRLEHETRTRDAALEMAIRELRLDVRQVQGDVRVLQGDVRGLAARTEALGHLDERVTALEKRFA